MEIIGWLGSLAFSICAIPQAYHCFKNKHANGVSWLFIILWLLGEILTLIYVIPKGHLPLIVNYALNIVFIVVILYYKIMPKGGVV